VSALDWHEQKRIARDIGMEHDYDGGFRFAYYSERQNYLAYYYTDTGRYKDSLITFYKPCENLTREEFKCVVLHELGHYNDVKEGSREEKLSESYADDYMVRYDDTCERFYAS
jgi:predicted Zn-dependent protease with MMP-like domain